MVKPCASEALALLRFQPFVTLPQLARPLRAHRLGAAGAGAGAAGE